MSPTDLLAWLAVGVVVLVLAAWCVVAVRAAVFERKSVVIAPFQVTGRDDPDDRLARSLASLLQGRLRQAQREFEASQGELLSAETPTDDADPPRVVASTHADTRLVTARMFPPVALSTKPLAEPPRIDVKVAGIELGGVAAWLDRVVVRKRTVTVAVHFGDEEALVTANLEAMPGTTIKDVWLTTAADPGEVVTAVAYAVLQATMATGEGAPVGDLRPDEFRRLLTELSRIADLNRRIAAGQPSGSDDFRAVHAGLLPILESAPEWPELLLLVAQVAERGDDPAQALALYQRLRHLDDDGRPLEPALKHLVERRIDALPRATATPAISAQEEAFVDAVRDYEKKLGLGDPHPQVVFMPDPKKWAPALAVWNDELHRYEVDPAAAAGSTLELEKYTALMGRFMALHYDRCRDELNPEVWNQFRLSVVDFVITTEPGTTYPEPSPRFPLFDTLTRISRSAGVDAVRRLALRLIDRYECGWTQEDLPDRVAAVATEVDVPPELVRRAFADAG